MRSLYKILKNLITLEEAAELAELIRNYPKNDGDSQVRISHSYGNIPATLMLLGRLAPQLSKITKRKLTPTYTYTRVYLKGADLKPHKDRPSCEYSVTLNLSKTHPWAIYMGKKAYELESGDGVLYKGCEIEHSRKVFEGDEYIQVFLHYVDSEGPYKDYKYDKITKEERVFQFVFRDAAEKHAIYPSIVEDTGICNEDIDLLIERMNKKVLNEAQVGEGEGSIVPGARRSSIFWIPKTEEYAGLYSIFHKLIGEVNAQYYRFNITAINSDIQYTVYDSANKGHYDWHVDLGNVDETRKLSVVLQLSDPSEYEGGQLEFNNGTIIKMEKKKGLMTIFPSYLLHRVTPVTKGIRRTLVLWVAGNPFC
jgi:PKHD-type hydroxylase